MYKCGHSGARVAAHLAHRPPLVTIITPTLNQGRFIEGAIRSIRDQSYSRIEHIVIDGGSGDGTLETLRRLEGAYDMRWVSESDRGMYDAINKGLAGAKGEVLAYLNSDDVYPPWAVEVAVEALRASPGIDVIFGDGLAIDVETGRQRLAFVPPFDASSMARVGSLVQPAVFIRRGVYERFGGFDPDLRFVGDLEYWLRIAKGAQFGRVNEVLAVERIHGAAMSSASAAAMALEETAIRRRYRPATDRLGRLAARSRAAVWRRRLWIQFLRSARTRGSIRGGWSHILSEGDLVISPQRVALALIPRVGAPFAWHAVRSRRNWFGLNE
jgi:glycosyltransferase involved in cell wall biosynthesis